MLPLLAFWCCLVQGDAMPRRSAEHRKRFSVSLSQSDYERLQRLAVDHRPQLTLQYVVEYAIHRMLSDVVNGTISDDFANPLRTTDRD